MNELESNCTSVCVCVCFFPTTEENESGTVQTKPRLVGREPTSYDPVQRANLPPLEKLKVSATPMANGLGPHPSQPTGSGATDTSPSGPAERPLAHPGSKGQTDVSKAREAWKELPPSKGTTEAEALGAGAPGPLWGTAGEPESPVVEAGREDTQLPAEMSTRHATEDRPPDTETEPPGSAARSTWEQSDQHQKEEQGGEETVGQKGSPRGIPDLSSPGQLPPASTSIEHPAEILQVGAQGGSHRGE